MQRWETGLSPRHWQRCYCQLNLDLLLRIQSELGTSPQVKLSGGFSRGMRPLCWNMDHSSLMLVDPNPYLMCRRGQSTQLRTVE